MRKKENKMTKIKLFIIICIFLLFSSVLVYAEEVKGTVKLIRNAIGFVDIPQPSESPGSIYKNENENIDDGRKRTRITDTIFNICKKSGKKRKKENHSKNKHKEESYFKEHCAIHDGRGYLRT